MNCNIHDIQSWLGLNKCKFFLKSNLVVCIQAIDTVNLFLEICPKEINIDVNKDLCIMIFMAALFTTVQNWKQLEVNNNMENV